jgi:hypothetical protein
MTVLPIVERELRARARNRSNYWGRFAMGAVGLLASVPPLLWAGAFSGPAANGRDAFHGLMAAAFLLCCAACLLTADAISGERREGTLGLLLLTRVRHFDVLAGKFASVGLTSLLGLAAFLPVMGLPILVGGVTGGEAARSGLALIDTLILALSVGLCVSSRGVDRFRTARAALSMMAGLVLLPLIVGLIFRGTQAGLASPLGLLLKASDSNYKGSANSYWVSLAVVQGISWVLLVGAAARLRGLGQDVWTSESPFLAGTQEEDSAPEAPPVKTEVRSLTSSAKVVLKKCRYCGGENDAIAVYCHGCGTELQPRKRPPVRPPPLTSQPGPIHWLLRRQRGLRTLLWVAATVGFIHQIFFGFLGTGFGRGMVFMGLTYPIHIATSATIASLFAYVAGRFFIEAQRSGELELLLTTPVGAKEMISTQWTVLKRMVLGPVLLMLVSEIFTNLLMLLARFGTGYEIYYVMTCLFGVVNTIVGVGAVCWLGLWFGFRGGQGRAVLRTVLLAKGVPYGVWLAWWFPGQLFLSHVVYRSWSSRVYLLQSVPPEVMIALYSLWLIRLARRQLSREVAGAEPLTLRQSLFDTIPPWGALLRRVRSWPPSDKPG